MAKDDSVRRKGGRGPARDDENRPRRRPRNEDEDDEEEERPRRRPARDQEDDDDRPRRKRRPREEEDEIEDEEVAEDEEEDRPRKGEARRKWEKVHLGLGFSIASAAMVLGFVGALVFSQVLVLVAGFLDWAELLGFAGMLVLLAVILYVGMEAPALVGCALFLNTPNKKGVLLFAIISLVIATINLVVRIIFLILPVLDQGTGFGIGGVPLAGLIMLILGDVEFIVFPFYMKAVMRTLRDKYLAEALNIPIALACGEIGFKIVLVVVLQIKRVRGEGGQGMIAMILGIVTLLVLVFFALSYLKAIIAVRRRVGAKLPAREEDL